MPLDAAGLFDRDLTRKNVSGVWHRMAVPFQFGFSRNRDPSNGDLWFSARVGVVRSVVPGCRGLEQDFRFDAGVVGGRHYRRWETGRRKRCTDHFPPIDPGPVVISISDPSPPRPRQSSDHVIQNHSVALPASQSDNRKFAKYASVPSPIHSATAPLTVPCLRSLTTDRKSTRLNSSHLGISYAV